VERPLIGITAIPRPVRSTYGEVDAHTSTDSLVASVITSGAVPLLIPLVDATDAAAQAAALDGLVLAGGQDVSATLWGGSDRDGAWVHPARDAHELALLAAARERGLPVLAVCRGLQLAVVAAGGELIGHVDGHNAGNRVADALHDVEVVPRSRLAEAVDGRRRIAVTSLHHQAARRLGAGQAASATSGDGLLEAAEAEHGAWLLGVQWHPELMGETPGGQGLFDALAAQARHTTA